MSFMFIIYRPTYILRNIKCVANVGLVLIYRVGIIDRDYALNIMLLVKCSERTYCHGNPWGDV